MIGLYKVANLHRISFAFVLHIWELTTIFKCLSSEQRLDFGITLYVEVVVIFNTDKCSYPSGLCCIDLVVILFIAKFSCN